MSELWRPSRERIANANLTRFMRCVSARTGTPLADYDATYAWSLSSPAQFWGELARFADLRADLGDGPVIEHPTQMPGARFFPGARLNFAENLLKFADEHPALIFRNERGARRALSGRELAHEVARVAAGLTAAGVVAGERVAGYLPNVPEATIAMLATASIGAVWSSCSPDFGVPGVLDRFGQIQPKVLFTADGYFYAGKTLDSLAPMAEVLEKLSHIERVVVIPYVTARPELARLGRAAREPLGRVRHARRAAALRASALQPSALHPLLLRHHRGPEVHRARCRRHAAATSEGAAAAHRPRAQRPTVLLHHLRLDDVELADERPGDRCDARALRRQS